MDEKQNWNDQSMNYVHRCLKINGTASEFKD